MNETMQNEQTVTLLWRFYTGAVSGIVIASNEEEALERTKHYLSIQFDDISRLPYRKSGKRNELDAFKK